MSSFKKSERNFGIRENLGKLIFETPRKCNKTKSYSKLYGQNNSDNENDNQINLAPFYTNTVEQDKQNYDGYNQHQGIQHNCNQWNCLSVPKDEMNLGISMISPSKFLMKEESWKDQ